MAQKEYNPTKERLHEIMFEADTPAGRLFDIALIVIIILSVLVVLLESVPSINKQFGGLFEVLEWIFTIIFTIEYGMRLYSVYRPMKYATSFFGVIDLLAVLPTYIGFLFPWFRAFAAFRALRIIRIFRIFNLAQFTRAGEMMMVAYRASKPRIAVTLTFILIVAIIMGSVMYSIEAETNEKFDSIPRSIYWAIVTITTVGYGDISPNTQLGQFLAATIMIIGYVVIAVGIVSVDMDDDDDLKHNNQSCRYCAQEGHEDDAVYCKYCGEMLHEEEEDD